MSYNIYIKIFCGETKRFAGTDKQKPIAGIPDIAWVAIVVVDPKLTLVAIQVERVEKAVRISNMQNAACATALRSFINDLGAVSNSASLMQ